MELNTLIGRDTVDNQIDDSAVKKQNKIRGIGSLMLGREGFN